MVCIYIIFCKKNFLKPKSFLTGKLISVRGCVIRVGHVKHLPEWIVFICRKCNLQKMVKQPLGVYTVPKKCSICGVSKFRVLLDSPLIRSVSFQIIKIQELSSDEQVIINISKIFLPSIFLSTN